MEVNGDRAYVDLTSSTDRYVGQDPQAPDRAVAVVEAADGHGAVGVAGVEAAQGADAELGHLGAAGKRHEGDAAVVPVAADAFGVAADPEALGGGDQANTPSPRSRPGFQGRGRPLTGSRAAMPSRATAPGPARSPAKLLFIQRWWPPT